jgi:hypothetical protein
MEMLQDPRPKKTSFLFATVCQIIAIAIIFLAFTHGIGWLIIVLQVWIIISFVLGVYPQKVDAKYLKNRLRFEQIYIYPTINTFFYGVMSADPILTTLYFIGSAFLAIKYSDCIKRLDYDYSVDQHYKKIRKNELDNHWTTY